MALPTYTSTGTVATSANLLASYAVQTGSLPPVQTAFVQTVTGNVLNPATYATSGSTAAAISKIVVASGALTSNTSAASALDVVLGLDVGGTAAGLTHIRELLIFNDGRTSFATTDTDVLIWDFSVSNSWGPGAAGTGPLEGTNPKIDIPCGTVLRLSKPFGAAGWTVDGTHKLICLGTPAGNANTINYRVIVGGDSA